MIDGLHAAELIIAKQRNGPVDKVLLMFIKEITRLENREKQTTTK